MPAGGENRACAPEYVDSLPRIQQLVVESDHRARFEHFIVGYSNALVRVDKLPFIPLAPSSLIWANRRVYQEKGNL